MKNTLKKYKRVWYWFIGWHDSPFVILRKYCQMAAFPLRPVGITLLYPTHYPNPNPYNLNPKLNPNSNPNPKTIGCVECSRVMLSRVQSVNRNNAYDLSL